MLARSATAGQATFEPDEDDEEEEEELDEEDDEPLLLTFSAAFLSLFPDLSPDESEEPESAPGFLASDPFAAALAGSESFCAARLSVR
jgi:hypothetical protein